MKYILIITFPLMLLSCKEEAPESVTLTYEYFQSELKPDMNEVAVLKVFGPPARDIGSGIHIYVYELSDSTLITIGCASKVYYANHMDKDNQVLHVII